MTDDPVANHATPVLGPLKSHLLHQHFEGKLWIVGNSCGPSCQQSADLLLAAIILGIVSTAPPATSTSATSTTLDTPTTTTAAGSPGDYAGQLGPVQQQQQQLLLAA